MSTNPNNAIGTNGAFGGRTSVNAFNDVMGALSRGVLSGWACVPNSGLTVSLGGDGTTRDTAIAEDNAGNKTSINNISNSPVNVTIGAAPGTNSRIDAIVAYVDNPPSGTSTVTDNPGACGLIVVEGTAASTPVAPNDSKIRTAITADGASGTTAYYVVLAYITMASGTTDITSNIIRSGEKAIINTPLGDAAVKDDNIDFTTFTGSVFPVVTTEFGIGWENVARLTRVANLVIVSSVPLVFDPTVHTQFPLDETIPDGYKPINPSVFAGVWQDGVADPPSWEVHPDGKMLYSSMAGAVRFIIHGVWVTNDDWPS